MFACDEKTYSKIPSHVIKIVQLKPATDSKPKFRWREISFPKARAQSVSRTDLENLFLPQASQGQSVAGIMHGWIWQLGKHFIRSCVGIVMRLERLVHGS